MLREVTEIRIILFNALSVRQFRLSFDEIRLVHLLPFEERPLRVGQLLHRLREIGFEALHFSIRIPAIFAFTLRIHLHILNLLLRLCVELANLFLFRHLLLLFRFLAQLSHQSLAFSTSCSWSMMQGPTWSCL